MNDYSRIEELENALEGLLECFDRSFEGRPWIEVEVENDTGIPNGTGVVIAEGQVNQITADAIALAEEVLYTEDMAGGYDGDEG